MVILMSGLDYSLAPIALLVQLSSFGAYLVVLREAYTCIVPLGGKLYPMLCEGSLMLGALVLTAAALALRLFRRKGEPR